MNKVWYAFGMKHTPKAKATQRVNVDFPLDLLADIDAACQRTGIARQAWIRMVLNAAVVGVGPSASDILFDTLMNKRRTYGQK